LTVPGIGSKREELTFKKERDGDDVVGYVDAMIYQSSCPRKRKRYRGVSVRDFERPVTCASAVDCAYDYSSYPNTGYLYRYARGSYG
jgi:hypothetical protein